MRRIRADGTCEPTKRGHEYDKLNRAKCAEFRIDVTEHVNVHENPHESNANRAGERAKRSQGGG